MDLRRWTPLLGVALLAAAWWLVGRSGPSDGATGPERPAAATAAPAPAPARAPAPGRAPVAGYAPASAAPKDAIPGGGLERHEGLHGAHTIERHVGRSVDDLRRRAESEAKREVSTFTDLATADRAVAEVLFGKQAEIRRWLASRPTANEAFEARVSAAAGAVYRRDTGRTAPGRTVTVVLHASEAFPEGFRIHTAYVSLP